MSRFSPESGLICFCSTFTGECLVRTLSVLSLLLACCFIFHLLLFTPHLLLGATVLPSACASLTHLLFVCNFTWARSCTHSTGHSPARLLYFSSKASYKELVGRFVACNDLLKQKYCCCFFFLFIAQQHKISRDISLIWLLFHRQANSRVKEEKWQDVTIYCKAQPRAVSKAKRCFTGS